MIRAPQGGEAITLGSIVVTIGLLAALALPSGAFGDKPADPGGGEDVDATAQDIVVTLEETAGGPATAEITSTEPADTDAAVTEETTEDAAVESGVADSSVETTSVTQTQEATYSQATVTTETVVRRSRGKRAKRAKRSRKCAAPVAQASAPPAPGCTRLNSNSGNLVLPDGTTLTITEPSQGIMNFTVSGGPTGTFTGTIFVKGGPSSPGFACVFNNVTSGTCNTPTQPNGNLYGVSHVDACPGTFVPPGDSGTPATPGGSGGQDRDDPGKRAGAQSKAADPGGDPAAAAVVETDAAGTAGQLAFTGHPVIWLILIGGGLIGAGLGVRRAA